MANIVTAIIILSITAPVIVYIGKEQKKCKGCMGCPHASKCRGKKSTKND